MLITVTLALTISCADYERENFRMETGKKYALKKWPDSAYIDTLDRFFAKEPIKQQQKQKAEISMDMSNNTMSLPKKNNTPEKKSQNSNSLPKKDEENKATESFPDKFFYALSKLSENPGSKEFGRKYKAKGGETLDDLLVRIYGQQIRKVPKYISESMLKQLNPGVDLSSLSEEETVLLPVIK
jgi:hypothetical protein